MLRKLSILLFIFSFNSIFSQSIIGEWFFENVQDSNANELFEVKKTDSRACSQVQSQGKD